MVHVYAPWYQLWYTVYHCCVPGLINYYSQLTTVEYVIINKVQYELFDRLFSSTPARLPDLLRVVVSAR
jgi:hypothetical protein